MATVTEIAHAVADKIEERGHYRGEFGGATIHSIDDPKMPCCIVVNPAYQRVSFEESDQFIDALAVKLGIDINSLKVDALGEIYKWNDSAPTQEVLDTLRSL